jgi:hypothetical protein
VTSKKHKKMIQYFEYRGGHQEFEMLFMANGRALKQIN